MPNKSLLEYLAFPNRYKEDEASYLIVDKKNNGYLSCYMKADLEILLKCSTILMLKGWEGSKGALLEYQIAQALGLEVMYER